MTRAKDVKKSSFIAKTTFTAGDYVDFVRNGQNFRIAYADFVAALGVSGNIFPVGDATAIPVYFASGSLNYIRSIIGGSGIVASISSGNGVQIGHNFTVDKTGAPVLANETAVSPTIRSIIGGTGITVAASGTTIQISESGTPGTTKTVFVYQKSDLPTPAAGVITLADDTEYRFLNDVSIGTDRFALGENTVLSATDEDLIAVSYTGAATMMTILDQVSNNFNGITFNCTSGTFIDFDSTVGTDSFYMSNCNVNCASFGDFNNVSICFMKESQIVATTQGMTFTGSCGLLYAAIELYDLSTAVAAKAIDLGTSTWNYINLENLVFNMQGASSYCISGATGDANLNSGGFGIVTKCHQLGAGTFLENISPFDNQWEFALNTNAVNSNNLCLVTHGGATITISASSTPVIIGATWNTEASHRFTTTTGGRWTYTGKGAQLSFTASITGQRAASGSDTYRFYLYKNGVQIANSIVSRIFTNADGNVSLIWADDVATGDYYELWVENQTGTADFTVSALTMRITG